MHDIIKFVAGAVSRVSSPGVQGCIIARHGSIYAHDGKLYAGVTADLGGIEFAVPAVELEAALARIKTVQDLTIDNNKLIVRGGRLKASIDFDTGTPAKLPAMPEAWNPYPTALSVALKLALGFTSSRANWTQGIWLSAGRLVAVEGRIGISIAIPDLALESALLSPATAEFLASQAVAPSEIAGGDNYLYFRWADGRWARTQLLNYPVPTGTVDGIFAQSRDIEEPFIAITSEWREALEDAIAMSDKKLILSAQGFRLARTGSRSEVNFETGLPAEHKSGYSSEHLKQVFTAATSWAPTRYPAAIPFRGKDIEGLILGMALE